MRMEESYNESDESRWSNLHDAFCLFERLGVLV